MTKYFYAENDYTVKNELSWGFVNSKIALAFKSKKERDQWIDDTNYLGAKSITRREALKMNKSYLGHSQIEIFGTGETPDYLIIEAK